MKLGEGAVAKRHVAALAPDRDLQALGNLQPPERRHGSADLGDAIKQRVRGGSPLVLEIPTECQRRVEDDGTDDLHRCGI